MNYIAASTSVQNVLGKSSFGLQRRFPQKDIVSTLMTDTSETVIKNKIPAVVTRGQNHNTARGAGHLLAVAGPFISFPAHPGFCAQR